MKKEERKYKKRLIDREAWMRYHSRKKYQYVKLFLKGLDFRKKALNGAKSVALFLAGKVNVWSLDWCS